MVWDSWNFFYRVIGASLKNSHPEWTQETNSKRDSKKGYVWNKVNLCV